MYPHVDTIRSLSQTHGRDPHAGADHPNALGRLGEDFYALRPYVVGDDLRRVHWPSTARHDELMVRQDELPWQGRATVLLDVRRGAHTPDSLEQSISAAASIITACWRKRDLVRLLATDGTDTGFAAGHAHVEAIMEYLATVSLSGTASMRAVIESLARTAGGGGALVVLVANVPTAEMDAFVRLRRRFSSVTVVAFGDRPKGEPKMGSRRRLDERHRRRQGHDVPPAVGHRDEAARAIHSRAHARDGSGSGMSRSRVTRTSAELALVGVSLANVIGFIRVFADFTFLPVLATTVVAAASSRGWLPPPRLGDDRVVRRLGGRARDRRPAAARPRHHLVRASHAPVVDDDPARARRHVEPVLHGEGTGAR